MGGSHRPSCPCCGSPLWKTHKKFWLKCPKCGHRFKIDDPRLVLHTLSNLADRRATFISPPGPGGHSRPSEFRRQFGIDLNRKFALIRCKCKNHLIVRRGQQTRLCPRCGRRFWLRGCHVVHQSNDLKLLSNLRWGQGNYYRPNGFVPADKLLAHSSHTAEGSEARDYGSRNPKPKRVTELVAT